MRIRFSITVLAVFFIFLLPGCNSDPEEKHQKAGYQPILFDGEYRLYKQASPIGVETITIQSMDSERLLIDSDAIIDRGYKYQHDAEFAVRPDWRIDFAKFRCHSGGLTRTLVIEYKDSIYSCELSFGDGRRESYTFADTLDYVIQFDLFAFKIPILKALHLGAGQTKVVNTILVETLTLKVFDAKFRYTFLESDSIQVQREKIVGNLYRIEDLHGRWARFIWTDEYDIPLYYGDSKEGKNLCRVSRYDIGSDIKSSMLSN
ncbi:MAG: hypothetical protein GF315_11510 [candidate division Zixibacteria bacterium]|nr:hypothetical protein [candidate division Zixibacteria bacterium]